MTRTQTIQSKVILPSQLADDSSTAKELLGTVVYTYDSTNRVRGYKYVQAASDTTVANGTPLAFSDLYGVTVSSDISDADRNQPAGVGIGAITASQYGWIQVYGYHSVVITNGDDDIADGDTIILSTTDGKCDSVASGTAPTHKPLGIAVAADVDADDTVATFLTVCSP